MKFFACRVCAERDSRIQDLKQEIAFLRSQLSPQNDPYSVSAAALEADGVLSGQTHVITIPDPDERAALAEFQTADDEISERDRILAGNYQ